MEIQRIGKMGGLSGLAAKEEVAASSISFKDVIGKRREDIAYERLAAKMSEIETAGKKLVETQTVDHLRKYKKMVKDFLQDAVNNGLELKEQRGFNQRGSQKVYKLVKEVDKKLIDLTNAVLEKEEKGLGILGLVGEIEGLLINIYT